MSHDLLVQMAYWPNFFPPQDQSQKSLRQLTRLSFLLVSQVTNYQLITFLGDSPQSLCVIKATLHTNSFLNGVHHCDWPGNQVIHADDVHLKKYSLVIIYHFRNEKRT